MPNRSFGWIPDLPDRRDNMYSLTSDALAASGVTAPDASDLRSGMPRIWDQGPLGSCCGWAGVTAHWYRQNVQEQVPYEPSALYVYFNARNLAGYAKYDVGSTIRDTMKALGRWGACAESTWPYVPSRFRNTPSKASYREGAQHQSKIYRRVERSVDAMRLCLSDNRPVVFGFSVYESFMSADVEANGYVPMPQRTEKLLGGHAVVKCGYMDAEERFICRNQWGADWGEGGYFYLPYAFITDPNLSGDFWTLDSVE